MAKCVIFQGTASVSGAAESCDVNQETTPPLSSALGLYVASSTAGMLLKETVSSREIKVTEKVAFNRGSSQQGKALRAAVGCNISFR